MSRPKFRVWSECYICGNDYPQGEMMRHKRLGRLVCHRCDDDLGFSDVKAMSDLPTEERKNSEQPVRDQGYVAPNVGSSSGGAGGGGAGGGGAA